MGTDPSLHDDIGNLTKEIRELSEKFSAKEVLAEKAAELAQVAHNASIVAKNTSKEAARITRNYRRLLKLVCVVLALVVISLVLLVRFAAANRELANCQAQFNKATELRSSVLTKYAKDQRAAMEKLVKARGLPNDENIIAARDSWLEANWLVDEANKLNPVIKYEDYCKNVPGVDPPKVPPAKVPDRSLYPGPQLQVP